MTSAKTPVIAPDILERMLKIAFTIADDEEQLVTLKKCEQDQLTIIEDRIIKISEPLLELTPSTVGVGLLGGGAVNSAIVWYGLLNCSSNISHNSSEECLILNQGVGQKIGAVLDKVN